MRNNLKAEEYWQWRSIISDMNTAQEKLSTAGVQLKVFEKETELLQARTQLFRKNVVEKLQEGLSQAKAEYERFKKHLESETGQSLNGKMIDDISFEIKELPAQEKPKS